jgi:hypothetical protein
MVVVAAALLSMAGVGLFLMPSPRAAIDAIPQAQAQAAPVPQVAQPVIPGEVSVSIAPPRK